MVKEAPDNKMLETHDGVIYFPKELMPDEHDQMDSVRVGGGSLMSLRGSKGGNTIHDIVPPYILKSKQLNLKLKFKNSLSSKRKGSTNQYRLSKLNSGFMTSRGGPRPASR